MIGIGTWQITGKEVMSQTLNQAFELGYRLIDTAAAYGNEMIIGKALLEISVNREELFIQDKLWNTNRGYKQSQEACKKSLRKLKIDYLDSYLIHWPASKKLHENWEEINAETWRGMEALQKEGLVRNIGVCNFKIHHLESLCATASMMPQINQLEIHPGMLQHEIVEYCRKKHIIVEASSPLGNGQILENNVLIQLAEQKHKTTAQICLRWAIEKQLVVLPKSTKSKRLQENMDIFDFILAESEMKQIDAIPYCGGIGIDSDEVTEFG